MHRGTSNRRENESFQNVQEQNQTVRDRDIVPMSAARLNLIVPKDAGQTTRGRR